MTAPTTTLLDATTCPHGKRAGITVCLYCRQEARIAARRRRNQMLMRAGGLVVGVATLAGVLVATVIAIAPWSRSGDSQAAEVDLAPARAAVAASKPARPAAPRAPQALVPVVAEGRTDLGDSVYVERAGGEVTVHFDNSQLRTRFDEKFEHTVRTTLPQVYGADARAALDGVAEGTLVKGDLITELPQRGIEVSLTSGRTLTLYPLTRPGQDGPLVVAYRAVATR